MNAKDREIAALNRILDVECSIRERERKTAKWELIATRCAIVVVLGVVWWSNSAHATEPCDPTDAIFADGFEFIPPPWWNCWPHLTPPPLGWVCP